RLAADGTVLRPIDTAGLVDRLAPLRGDVAAVAVCLLHADLNGDHERAVATVLRDAGWDVTCSAEVSPQFREYERTVTTVINAMLRPRCRTYLQRLATGAGEVLVMTS